jgi:integrase
LKDDRARLLIRQALGYSSHYLRHSRATHLAQIYKLTAFDLKGVLGHTGMAIAATYVHAELQDRVKKLLETPV